ncbi:MAG: 4Fe-4S dicluster domain-containing protein, partial [Oligoflexia bacterium]|nr:4Fe-4S dicluster domain-containing protein [Oligoflexia bacterium]
RIINIFIFTFLLFGMAGVMGRQNFQIEGFFFYVMTGTFGGVIVHFMMAKIIGPVFTGRCWCSWGCWTISVLDLLPFKKSGGWNTGLKSLKFFHFILSLILVAVLILVFNYTIHNPNQDPNQPGTMAALYWFLLGNALYFTAGITTAFIFKDNRAFCKYLCPVSLFLKLSNTVSLLRIKGDKNLCTNCGKCTDVCLFNIDIPRYIHEDTRVKCSECVMCMKCVAACPQNALSASVGFDIVRKDYLKKTYDRYKK